MSGPQCRRPTPDRSPTSPRHRVDRQTIRGADPIPARWRSWITDSAFVCLGGSASFRQGQLHHLRLHTLLEPQDMHRLYQALTDLGPLLTRDDQHFTSLVVTVADEVGPGREFHDQLWQALTVLTALDVAHGVEHPEGYSDDPCSARFAFGLGGVAYFVVGLHPLSDRLARRSPEPGLVFNSHAQFERLRRRGGYASLKEHILRRERAHQAEPNLALTDFGLASEAAGYSGWTPPGWQPHQVDHVRFPLRSALSDPTQA